MGDTCFKCGGAGWVWWYELDEYDGPAIETGQDNNRYICDWCLQRRLHAGGLAQEAKSDE